MISLKRASSLTRFPWIYRLWMAPFAGAKLAPVLRHNDLGAVRRVLDVGCGPGTNAPYFAGVDYLGIDLDEGYVEAARRRHGRDFIAADARTFAAAPGERFDFILLNSLLHHLDTADVVPMLRQLASQLTPDGHVHILDLVLPASPGLARWLALSDRGDFPRPLEQWAEIFRDVFDQDVFEPYAVRALGFTWWQMVYFKGRRKGA